LLPVPDQAVSGQDLQQPPRVRVEPRSDQGEPDATLQQGGVAEQESPQEKVAQAGLLGHDPAQLLDRYGQHPARSGGHGAQERPLPGENADLTEELRGTVAGDDSSLRTAVSLDDVGRAGEQHDQVVVLVAVGEQHLTGRHGALAAVPAQHRKLIRIQDGGLARK
jgi:hypothetical protein